MITLGSLCSGVGALDLAAELAVGSIDRRWCADHDPDAARVLAHRSPAVPNLGDITLTDWTQVEPVDILTAGYPCQSFSNAGKRKGFDDERAVWPHVADAIRVLRPRLVLLENVPGHLARGFGRVLGDLATIGYVGSWMCLRASDLGAPHRRERVFIVAHPSDPHRQPLRIEPVRQRAHLAQAQPGTDSAGAVGLLPTPTVRVSDRGSWEGYRNGRPLSETIMRLLPTPARRDGDKWGQPSPDTAAGRMASGRRNLDDAVALLPTPWASEGAKGGPNQRGSSGDLTLSSTVMLLPTPTVADSRNSRNATAVRSDARLDTNTNGWTLCDVAHAGRWGRYADAVARWERVLGRAAPDPTTPGRTGKPRLSAHFVEWLMGLPAGWVTDVPDITRNAALRLLGNGVVPSQAAAAYVRLLAREGGAP